MSTSINVANEINILISINKCLCISGRMRQDEASKLTLPMNKDKLVTCCLLIIHYEELRFLHSMLLLYTLKRVRR